MKLMKATKFGLILGALSVVPVSSAYADVQVTINNGLVSVSAKDATVRQILTEWARVGQTKVINVERIAGGPISIELRDVTEEHALDVLLRSVSGYLVAPRATTVANLSRFERVFVLPTSAAPRQAAASTPAPPAFPQPQFPQPQFAQPFAQPTPDEDVDDDRPAPNVVMPQNGRGPVFNAFPQPQIVNPQTGQVVLPNGIPLIPQGQVPNIFIPGQATPAQQAPTAYPTAPFGGVAIPGMVAPAQQQQQPGQIGVPGVPVPNQPRRPGQEGEEGPEGPDGQ
jgi:hypothetical protein